MAKDNNIYNARYAPAPAARKRAHRSVEYLVKDRGEAVKVYGDPEAFREATKARVKEMDAGKRPGEKGAFVSLVLSPERGADFKDGDFEKLLPAWTQDAEGREYDYFAAVHRDTGSRGNGEGHDHMHLLVARDAYDKRELGGLKRQSREVIRGREKLIKQRERRAREYEQAREREPEQEPERKIERESDEPQLERQPEREPEREPEERDR